jgi:hypothetical protein
LGSTSAPVRPPSLALGSNQVIRNTAYEFSLVNDMHLGQFLRSYDYIYSTSMEDFGDEKEGLTFLRCRSRDASDEDPRYSHNIYMLRNEGSKVERKSRERIG